MERKLVAQFLEGERLAKEASDSHSGEMAFQLRIVATGQDDDGDVARLGISF